MSYRSLIQRLYSLSDTGVIKLGLENSHQLHKAVDFPANHFSSIHVAGTNGKGSVCTKIAKVLEQEGYSVGLYTSPHITTYRERIQVNGVLITEREVEYYLTKLFDIQDTPSTFFELTTLMAFMHFAENKVDYAIIETGLGGRLDSTNIITPLVSVITNISFDHTEILGSTLTEIAREKAGIIKPNVPVVIGPRTPIGTLATIAKERSSPLVHLPNPYPSIEEENQAIASSVLEILDVKPNSGILATPPCRFERHGSIVFDVAHNPDSLQFLFKSISSDNIGVVFGLCKTKDLERCIDIINTYASHTYPVSGNDSRNVSPLILRQYLKNCTLFPSIEDSVHEALKKHKTVLVTGTFYIMSEVLQIASTKCF